MGIIAYLVVGFIFAYIGRNIAVSKGRDYHAWFWICFFFPIAIILLLTLGETEQKKAFDAHQKQRELVKENRKCPFCAEYIKREAKVCKHCGRDVPPLEIVLEQPKKDSEPKELEAKEAEQSETQKNAE